MRFKKVYVEITNICNKNCSFCSKDNLPKKEMSIEEFKRVLDNIKPYTDYIYLHVKGEPLMHSKIKEIVNLCQKNNIHINLTTNGTYLPKYKDVLENDIIRQINISFQSYTSDEIDDILDSVDDILDKTKINVVYRFWALKENNLSDSNLDLINKIISHYKLNNSFLEEVINKQNIKIKERLYLNKEAIFNWPSENKDYLKESFCNGLKTHIGILSNGTVVPCCLDSSGIINLGNIFNESLDDILNKEVTKKIISNFKDNKCYMEICKKCTYRLNKQKML